MMRELVRARVQLAVCQRPAGSGNDDCDAIRMHFCEFRKMLKRHRRATLRPLISSKQSSSRIAVVERSAMTLNIRRPRSVGVATASAMRQMYRPVEEPVPVVLPALVAVVIAHSLRNECIVVGRDDGAFVGSTCLRLQTGADEKCHVLQWPPGRQRLPIDNREVRAGGGEEQVVEPIVVV